MKTIKMTFQGKVLTFQVIYQESAYCFCECAEKPEARGFFTAKYITENTIA